MRDIDFEELDKAVGSYLENGIIPNLKDKNDEVFSRIENQIEHSREQQKMVFARKAPQSANQLHHSNEKIQIQNIEKAIEKPKNEKKSIYKNSRVRILDDFNAPVPLEHHRDNFGTPLSVKEERIAFESPILETYGGEKPIRNIKKLENSPIRKKVVSKNEKTQVKKEAESIFKSLGLNMSVAMNLFLKKCINENGIPFDLKLPNKETIEAMEETNKILNGDIERKSYKNADELFEDLGV